MSKIPAFIIGAIAGVIGGVMIAPRTGQETREKVASAVDAYCAESDFYNRNAARVHEVTTRMSPVVKAGCNQVVDAVSVACDKVVTQATKAAEDLKAKTVVLTVEPEEDAEADASEATEAEEATEVEAEIVIGEDDEEAPAPATEEELDKEVEKILDEE